MRSRGKSPRKLSVEQETTLSGFGNLLTGDRGESVLQTAERLFGSVEAARTAWFEHRAELLADDPVAGRRPCGYWLFEQQREPPPSVEQAAILRELGELAEFEKATLASWARPRPEPPADLGIDQAAARRGEAEVPLFTSEIASANIGTVEDPHGTHPIDDVLDAGPVEASTEATEAEGGEAPEGVPETSVRPQILDFPRVTARPHPEPGWESHDVR